MAGAFGYGTDTHEVSREMAELDLAPAVRQALGPIDALCQSFYLGRII